MLRLITPGPNIQDDIRPNDSVSQASDPNRDPLIRSLDHLTNELHRSRLAAPSPNPTPYGRAGNAITPDKYTLSMDWIAYTDRFYEAVRLNGWTQEEAAVRLRFYLDSGVHELIDTAVTIPPGCTLDDLVARLTPLLSPVNAAATAEAQFSECKLGSGETYQHYIIELQKLALKAFPYDNTLGIVRRIRDRFIHGCADVELAKYILDHTVEYIDELVCLAEKHQSNKATLLKVSAVGGLEPRVADPWLPEMHVRPTAPAQTTEKQGSKVQTSNSGPTNDAIRTIIREELDGTNKRMANRIENLEKRVANQARRKPNSQSNQKSGASSNQNTGSSKQGNRTGRRRGKNRTGNSKSGSSQQNSVNTSTANTGNPSNTAGTVSAPPSHRPAEA